MSKQLRPYQSKAKEDIYQAWADGQQNVCLVLSTGAGKTVCLASIVHDLNTPTCVIAHRQELVIQLSLALAGEGVVHRIIGPKNVVQSCVKLHMMEYGRSFYDPSAKCGVAGVDTIIRRTDQLERWIPQVKLWVTDECHHLLEGNKWGKAVSMFPNAKGLGVTATPLRADRCGLGRHAEGVFDAMVVGPSMRYLIDAGYLTDYRIFAPPSDLDLAKVKISQATGDYSQHELVEATRNSHILGDVVTQYLKIAKGKRGLTFATDVKSAKEIAEQFNAAGVPAVAIDAKTPDIERFNLLRKFRSGEILQVVNVDLFGEGTDIPAVEVVSMARATQSYGLYVQIFGRALRLMEGKEHAIIIDHVGNVLRHGLPDTPRQWSLDGTDRKAKATDPNVIPVKACPMCSAVYERYNAACPYCGHKPIPQGRVTPELVDGDLCEITPDVLEQLRRAIEYTGRSEASVRDEMIAKHAPEVGVRAAVKRHREMQAEQAALRESIAWWAGYRNAQGMSDSEAYRRFYLRYGMDVMTAQTLPTGEVEALRLQIEEDLIWL